MHHGLGAIFHVASLASLQDPRLLGMKLGVRYDDLKRVPKTRQDVPSWLRTQVLRRGMGMVPGWLPLGNVLATSGLTVSGHLSASASWKDVSTLHDAHGLRSGNKLPLAARLSGSRLFGLRGGAVELCWWRAVCQAEAA